MVQTPTKPLTLDEFLKIPETKPASEFIEGKIIQKSMPQGKHSTCLAYGTQMGWLIDPEEKLVFVYFADQRIILFELEKDCLPVPSFADSFNLTVGQLFSWLTE